MKNFATARVYKGTVNLDIYSTKISVAVFAMKDAKEHVYQTGDSIVKDASVLVMKFSVNHLLNSMKDYANVLALRETADLDLSLISINVDASAIRMLAAYPIGRLTTKLVDVSAYSKIVSHHNNGTVRIATVHVSRKIATFLKFGMIESAIALARQSGHVPLLGLSILILASVDVVKN